MLEFRGLPAEFLDYWEHDGFEALYVIEGDIEVDIAGQVTALGVGDVLSYSSTLPHRLRSPFGKPARVMLVESNLEAVQDAKPAKHASKNRIRRTR